MGGVLMAGREGFTLTEIIVVIIIVGMSAAFAIPKFLVSIEQSKAVTAKNNLLAISAAEQRYFEDNASYCTITTGATANCGTNMANLNTNLKLSMSGNDPFTYFCASTSSTTYLCTATDGTVTLTTSGTVVACAPVGSSNCPS
jgi:prepilin-type N-terminal cleavage/methylation domain-containing protein